MFDRQAQELMRPWVERLAIPLAAAGVSANQITIIGFGIGVVGAFLLSQGAFWPALLLIWLSRLSDALDGAVARMSRSTDAGGFLDISLDFVFYASIPLAFAIHDPTQNALPAAVLLAGFIGTGSTFLAFAVFAAKRHLNSLAFPNKSFFYLGGLTEAGETMAVFSLMCIWPEIFDLLSYGFAVLCAFTTVMRIWWGWRAFK